MSKHEQQENNNHVCARSRRAVQKFETNHPREEYLAARAKPSLSLESIEILVLLMRLQTSHGSTRRLFPLLGQKALKVSLQNLCRQP